MTLLRFDIMHAESTASAAWSPRKPTGGDDQRGWQLQSLWRITRESLRRQRSRAQLVRMNAHMLKDIGITAAEAEYEANKPFWRG